MILFNVFVYQPDLISFEMRAILAAIRDQMCANEIELLTVFGHILQYSILSKKVWLFIFKSNHYNLSTNFNLILANSPEFWLGIKA
jgi:hypothetical protein